MLQKPKDPLGYTQKELISICKKRNINYIDFCEAFGINTCSIGEDGKPRYYKCDVERALWILNKKDGKPHTWD